MNASTEMVRLLMETGFMAAVNGHADEAMKIFDGVAAVRPGDEMPLLGRAIAQIHASRPKDAEEILNAALRINPRNDYAKSYKGMALLLSGKYTEARSVLENVTTEGREAGAVALANKLLCGMS